MKKLTITIAWVLLVIGELFSYNSGNDSNKVYGVTIDAISNLNAIQTSLKNLCKKPTTRIVFDEWIPASDYLNAVTKIKKVSYIMGEILDSYYMSQYSLQQYTDRVNDYLNTLGSNVDIWELGNEINGEWLGTTSSVVAKMTGAYNILKANNKTTALTLYYNFNCWENPANEMFRWAITNIPQNMKNGLDYVWISYYEDDCNNFQPNWQRVFDSLHTIFPNSKIGIGECGTTTSSKKCDYIKRYYSMKITTPNYVGGYFWWYFKQDCVPMTKAIWKDMNIAFSGITLPCPVNMAPEKINLRTGNYPNPFNPTTKIYYELSAGAFVELKIFDALGREVSTLVNQFKNDGKYIVEFNGSELSSGIYYYRIKAGDFIETKSMILMK